MKQKTDFQFEYLTATTMFKNLFHRPVVLSVLKRTISTRANNQLPKPFGGQIQFISDIHVDYNNFKGSYIVHPIAPTLIIAGDLGLPYSEVFHTFLNNNCKNFDQVILVPGNHEYFYDNTVANGNQINQINQIDQIDQILNFDEICNLQHYRKLPPISSTDAGKIRHYSLQAIRFRLKNLVFHYPNLKVLDRDQYNLKLPDGKTVKILGCTLWSHIPDFASQSAENLPDYKKINQSGTLLKVSDTNALHKLERNWLEKKLIEFNYDEMRWRLNPTASVLDDVLIVTHHAPLILGTCNPYFLKYGRLKHNNYAYASDLSYLMRTYKIKAWIHGHTHARMWQYKNQTLVVTNALGKVPKQTYQSLRSL